MEWTNSGGGPLICAERHIAMYWKGITGLSIENVTSARSDYERACTISEYLGTVACNNGCVLVLGDEPLQSTFVVDRNRILIARWVYVKSRQNPEEILRCYGDKAIKIYQTVLMTIDRGDLVLLDAAVQGEVLTNVAEVQIIPGIYNVSTERLEMAGLFKFIIHKFSKN